MGPDQDAAAVYYWKWYHSTPSLALWIVLAAGFVFIKANRTAAALLVLVPLLILNVLWLLFTKAMGFRSSDVEMFNMMFYSLVAGVTFLWLFAEKLGRYNRWAAFLLAFALMAVLCLVGLVSYLGLEFSEEALVVLMLVAILGSAMLLGLVLAGWRCRRRYGPVRFMLWLAVWTVAACLVNTLALYSVWFIVSEVPVPVFTVLLMAAVFGSVLGVILYVVVFPYMILALCSSFFRERFFACLRLSPMLGTAPQASPDAFAEQNPGTQTSEDSGSV